MAHEHGIKSVAFPSISTGAFGYPVMEAAQIAVEAVAAAFITFNNVEKIRFVLFDGSTLTAYTRAAERFASMQTEHRYSIEKESR